MSYNPVNAAKSVLWRAVFALRETGQALERVGCRLQGIYSYEEITNRHVPLAPVKFDAPTVGSKSFIAPSSLVMGKVTLGDGCSVWYNATVRGDREPVTVGDNTNIQDNAYVGAVRDGSPPVEIGKNVSVGHSAVLRGCKVGDNVLVGISAVVAEGAQVEPESIIAAGSYVEEGTVVPTGEVWAGNPAKKLRALKPEERHYLRTLPARYVEMGQQHEEIMKLLRHKQSDYHS